MKEKEENTLAEKIEAWKKKHEDVFVVSFEDGKTGYLKKPDRKIMSFAMTRMQTNPLGYAEVILQQCWLGGDDEIKTNDKYFFGAAAQLEKMIEVKNAELKKL